MEIKSSSRIDLCINTAELVVRLFSSNQYTLIEFQGHQRSYSDTEKLYPVQRTYGKFSQTFHGHPDERPITPMKDRMVYDVDHSSLDFDDGKKLFHHHLM